MPSRAAAASTLSFQRLRQAERDPARTLFPARHVDGVRSLIDDDHELGLTAGETDLDPTGFELSPDLESGLAEEVEEPEMERGPERLAQAASGLGGRLVAERCSRRELVLDRLDVALELHCDITMTSQMQSVKRQRSTSNGSATLKCNPWSRDPALTPCPPLVRAARP